MLEFYKEDEALLVKTLITGMCGCMQARLNVEVLWL